MKKRSTSLRNFETRIKTSRCIICGKKIEWRVQKGNSKYRIKTCGKNCRRLRKNELNRKYRQAKKEGKK